MTFSLVLSSSCDAIADPPTVTAKSVVAAGAESQATAAESNGRTVRLDAESSHRAARIQPGMGQPPPRNGGGAGGGAGQRA